MNLSSLTGLFTEHSGYLYQTFLIVFLALTLDFFQKKVLKKLAVQFEKTENKWGDAIVHAVTKPLSVLIWTIGISLAAGIMQQATGAVVLQVINPIRDTSIIATLAWFLIRLIVRVEDNLKKSDDGIDHTTLDAISKILRVSVVITATLVVLQTLGYSISGVLAFGGVGGIAMGFAAKDLLANFFGGLIIYLDRPFAVGDWIRSPDRQIEGTIENIGWRVTRIRTFDKRPLYVPNSVFSSIAVENPSRMLNRRIYETIGIRYADVAKMETITNQVREMLMAHPEIDADQTLIVNFNAFAPSSLDFFVYTFTRTTQWVYFHEVKQDILLRIIRIIEGEGAEIAFPTSTVHLSDQEIINKLSARN